MSYKSIVALTFGHAGDACAIEFAASLGITHKARADVFPFVPDPSLDLISYGMLLGTTLPNETSAAVLASQLQLREDLETLCRSVCNEADLVYGEGKGVPRMTLSRPAGRPEIKLSHDLALADLVVVSQESLLASAAAREAFGQALLQQRTPVLIARGEPDRLGGPAMIAWDGSAGAGRAVRQALPLIAMSAGATAVQCRQGLDRQATNPSFEPLLDYLGIHDVGEADTEFLDQRSAGDALVQAAKRLSAGLVIAGAYGHTRFRETMFGGATRAFLDDRAGPSLLLAH
jgi:nucleotide-binding universal stress UspA family protein